MALEDTGHRSENLNIKSFYGRLLRKIWLLPLAGVIGALAGFAIYFAAHVVYGPARNYETSSMLYLIFAPDDTGEVYDYYNGYTWNTLMSSDEIINTTMDYLKEMGITELASGSETPGSVEGGVTRDEVLGSVTASVPSDLRYLVITVGNTDKDLAQAILIATDKSLISYGDKRDEFISIKLEREDDVAKLETITDRTGVATALGAGIFIILVIIAMMLLDAMDDAIYVPEDGERRYHLPVLGVMPKKDQELPVRFKNELIACSKKILGAHTGIAVISVADTDENDTAAEVVDSFKNIVKSTFNFDRTQIKALPLPGTTLESYRDISECEGVIIAIPQGARKGTSVEHIISQLHKHDCPVLGIIMTDTDMKFLNWYYLR